MREILLDTNILIYSLNEKDKDCAKAQQFINSNLDHLVVADQVVNEAVRILTHTKYPGHLDTTKAIKLVRVIADECTHVTPNLHTRELFYKLVKKYRITSNNVYDAYLVATALSNSVVDIVTSNVKDFNIFKELQVHRL